MMVHLIKISTDLHNRDVSLKVYNHSWIFNNTLRALHTNMNDTNHTIHMVTTVSTKLYS
jgi:hypothetical protein